MEQHNYKQQTTNNNTMKQLIERLKEESTWRGLITVATLAGVHISPEQAEYIVSAGLALIGAIWIFTADKKAVVEAKLAEEPAEEPAPAAE
jgi:hypothetical protein